MDSDVTFSVLHGYTLAIYDLVSAQIKIDTIRILAREFEKKAENSLPLMPLAQQKIINNSIQSFIKLGYLP